MILLARILNLLIAIEPQKLTYGLFSKNAHTWDLHFHFDRDNGKVNCNSKVNEYAWDNQVYFKSSFVQEGVLILFAHFSKKAVVSTMFHVFAY